LISWSWSYLISWSHLDHILSDRWSYLTDDLMFPNISSSCAIHILWILLTCFRHVLHMAYACYSFPMLRISCSQHVLLLTCTCSLCCLQGNGEAVQVNSHLTLPCIHKFLYILTKKLCNPGSKWLSQVLTTNCYDFDQFNFSVMTKDSQFVKDVRFNRLKKMPWVLFQGIVLRSS